jgi:hypothetical protein
VRTISSLGLFLTRRCNFRCIYCNGQPGADPPDKLAMDEVRSALRQAREMGARRLVIPGEGEPLLDGNVWGTIDEARRLDMTVRIYTNGSLLDRTAAERLFRGGVSVVMKVHSLDPDLGDRLAGVEGSHRWVEDPSPIGGGSRPRIPHGLRHLLEAGYPGPRRPRWGSSLLQVETVALGLNAAGIPDISRWCRRRGIDHVVETLIPTGLARERAGELALDSAAETSLYRKIAPLLGWRFALDQRVRCRFETDPFLDASGNLRHCFGLAADVGNIRDLPLAELHRRETAIRRDRGMYSPLIAPLHRGFRMCATRRAIGEHPVP